VTEVAHAVPWTGDDPFGEAIRAGRGPRGIPFVCARLGSDAVVRHAAAAGFTERERCSDRGRHFVALRA
jgi:hypothetical protein